MRSRASFKVAHVDDAVVVFAEDLIDLLAEVVDQGGPGSAQRRQQGEQRKHGHEMRRRKVMSALSSSMHAIRWAPDARETVRIFVDTKIGTVTWNGRSRQIPYFFRFR